jgi:hypothetical protein
MVSGLPNSLYAALPPVSSCPTDGTDNCIQLRLDAVGYALTQLFQTANADEILPSQFRIGLYPFITDLYEYSKLTATINGSPSTPGTINYAAANLATQLDTNLNSSLGSGGTHIDNSLTKLNTNFIKSVGNGSTPTNTKPFVFLVTDGAQDPQSKGVPNGSWSGSNHATVMPVDGSGNPIACKALKDRGITVAVLNIPYQPINPVNASFANDEDDYANWNINGPPGTGIATNLQACASPGFYFSAATPKGITDALTKMFNQSLASAHITN